MDEVTATLLEIKAKQLLVDDIRKCQSGVCTFDNLYELCRIAGVRHGVCAWVVLSVHYITIFMEDGGMGMFSFPVGNYIEGTDEELNQVVDFVTGCFDRMEFNEDHEAAELVDWLAAEWLHSDPLAGGDVDDEFFTVMQGIHLMQHMAADLSRGRQEMMIVLEGAGSMN